jgi:hypothetical protein
MKARDARCRYGHNQDMNIYAEQFPGSDCQRRANGGAASFGSLVPWAYSLDRMRLRTSG